MLLEWDLSGFILFSAMTDMTDHEAEIIRQHKMTISAFTDRECVLPLWRFEDGDVYGETPFDPTVYQARIPGSREQIMRKVGFGFGRELLRHVMHTQGNVGVYAAVQQFALVGAAYQVVHRTFIYSGEPSQQGNIRFIRSRLVV